MRTNMSSLVAGLILMSACVARAQDLAKPMVLVPSPDLAGPYSHTALIVVPMGDQHIGFILNRATEARLATLFPEHAPSAKVAEPLFYGGPEAAGSVCALLRRVRRLDGGRARQGDRGRLLVRGRPGRGAGVPQEHRRDVGGAGDAARQRAPGAQGPASDLTRYCGVILPFRITSAYRSISRLRCAPSSSGVLPTAASDSCSKSARTALASSAFLSARLMVLTISRGVPAGA